MPRQLSKSSSWTKSHQLTTTTSDGSGCNSLGFAWPWSATILTSWESVSPHPLLTCQLLNKDSSPSKLWRSHCRQRRKNRPSWRRLKMFPNQRRPKPLWTLWTAPCMINYQIERTLSMEKYQNSPSSKRQRRAKELNNFLLSLIPSWVFITFQKKSIPLPAKMNPKTLSSLLLKMETTQDCFIPSIKRTTKGQFVTWMEPNKDCFQGSSKMLTKRWWRNSKNWRRTMSRSENRWILICTRTRSWQRDWKSWKSFSTTIRANSKTRRKSKRKSKKSVRLSKRSRKSSSNTPSLFLSMKDWTC